MPAARCAALIHLYCGLPWQVLPPDMMELADPSAEGLVVAMRRALGRVGQVRPHEQHNRVSAVMARLPGVLGASQLGLKWGNGGRPHE